MSIFLEILRCILCCDEGEEYETRVRSDRNRSYSFNRSEVVPRYDTFSRSFASTPSSTSDSHSRLTSQSGAQSQTTTQIHTPTYSKSSSSHLFQTRDLSYNNSIPTKPKSTIDYGIQYKSSSLVIKPETNKKAPEKSPEIPQKPKAFELPPPSSNYVVQSKIINSGNNKTTHQTTPLSSSKPPPSAPSPKPSPKPVPSTKPTLSLAPSNPTNSQAKNNYVWAQKGASLIYAIPEDLKDLFKNDVVPRVLRRPLSPSTYKDYFDALLYAEDYYIEKWDGFEMKNVTLKLHEAAIYKRKGKSNNWNVNGEKDDKIFVAFEMDSIPEKRPFLLSRDFVSVQPSGNKAKLFQGLIYRVIKSNLVLVEFGEDFHSQHYSACKYEVKFSFNRVCLKRAHQAIAAASDPLFRNVLFPDCIPKNNIVAARLQSIDRKLDQEQVSAVRQILSRQNPPPYLVEGPLSVMAKQLSRTGVVVCEAVLQIYRTYPSCRILICAPTNGTCDVFTRRLKEEILESDMFRANAAFREVDGVPFDIFPTCAYEGECFTCPSLQELRKFKVILSTFMSSFRLHNEGIMAGHFSHMFLVDASSATEPEAMVALSNLANETTTVTITGAPRNHSGWVRSSIARKNGLMTSYFERLRESKLYKSLDLKVIAQVKDSGQKSEDSYSSLSFR